MFSRALLPIRSIRWGNALGCKYHGQDVPIAAWPLPIAIGFGISRPDHVAAVTGFADAAVVGSALVSVIAEHGRSPDLADRVGEYVRWLKSYAHA